MVSIYLMAYIYHILTIIIKFIGPIFIIVGIGVIFDKKNTLEKIANKMTSSYKLMLLTGLMSFIIGGVLSLMGLILLLSNNTAGYIIGIIIFIFGILGILKGLLLILLPKQMRNFSATIMVLLKDLLPYIGFVYLLIGISISITVYYTKF